MGKIKGPPPYFDDEERELIESIEEAMDRGELVSTLTPERRAQLQAMARTTMAERQKDVTARLSEYDIARLKARASEKGVTYQALLASIVHQYVEGTLVEKK